jgi:glycosyltransferase involved in cell wall biosynthesis
MACGLPVVATDVGGVSDYCSHKNAILLKNSNADSYVEAILRILNNKTILTEMGDQSRQLIESKFSWNVISSQVIQLYKKISQ